MVMIMCNSEGPSLEKANLIIQKIGGRPANSEEVLMMMKTNCSYEEAKLYSAEHARLRILADEVRLKPLGEWPAFDLVWDCRPEMFHHAYDGADGPIERGDLRILNDVSIAAIDAALTPYWRRRPDEVWTIGDPDKAAGCIVHWVEARAMTPPLFVPTEDSSQLVLAGGNHRLAVARAKGANVVPVLVRTKDSAVVSKLLGRTQ